MPHLKQVKALKNKQKQKAVLNRNSPFYIWQVKVLSDA